MMSTLVLLLLSLLLGHIRDCGTSRVSELVVLEVPNSTLQHRRTHNSAQARLCVCVCVCVCVYELGGDTHTHTERVRCCFLSCQKFSLLCSLLARFHLCVRERVICTHMHCPVPNMQAHNTKLMREYTDSIVMEEEVIKQELFLHFNLFKRFQLYPSFLPLIKRGGGRRSFSLGQQKRRCT